MNNKIACIWGCSSTCTLESNYVCSGGTTSNLMSRRWTFFSNNVKVSPTRLGNL